MLSKKSTPQQDWEFAHSLIAHSLICSFAHSLIRSNRSNQISECKLFTQIAQDKWATVSESFWLLTKNCSGRSPKMSDHEGIAHVAHQKWANEWIACFFEKIAHSLIFSQKTSDSLKNQLSVFPALLHKPWSNFFNLIDNVLFECEFF